MGATANPLRLLRADPALLGWLGVGLALRLLLMPFAVSADLLAVYWRAHLIAHHGTVFDAYLVNMGAHYVHAAALRVLAPLLPPAEQVWTHPWWWADASALAPQLQREFSTAPGVYQTLFALKVPYLVADLATGLLLLALVAAAAPRLRRRAWAFWMLSPIGLYAAYVFARYEPLAVVLVVAALFACERKRPWTGALLLGVGITMRSYPLLLVPVFALIAVRGVPGWRLVLRQGAWAALALTPFAAMMVLNRALAGSVGELARLKDYSTGSTFFAYTVPVDGTGQVFLFPLFAFVLVGILLARSLGWWGAGPPPLHQLWIWLLVLHVGMFGLATFSAHYFMWFTPFVALALARRPAWRAILPLHLVQVVLALAIADTLGGPGTTWGLFEPLAPEVATSLPNLREALLTRPALAEQLVGLLRTAFLAVTVLLASPAFVELVRTRQPTSGEGERAGEQQQPREQEGRPLVQTP